MAKFTTPTRQCAWHHKDGSPCTAQTILTLEEYGGIPICRSHKYDCSEALYAKVEEEVDFMRAVIEREAIDSHREDEGCDVLRYIAEQEERNANYVYYMRSGDYIKIGRSKRPVTRLAEVRAGSGMAPDDLDRSAVTLERVQRADVEVERDRHIQFGHLRVVGEWFRAAPELESLMSRLPLPEDVLPRAAA